MQRSSEIDLIIEACRILYPLTSHPSYTTIDDEMIHMVAFAVKIDLTLDEFQYVSGSIRN